MIKREEINIKNIFYFFQGYIRYFILRNESLRKRFLRKHIEEQISYRINSIKKECYKNGSCIYCGCEVPQLQMANKSCGGNCYPIMFNKKDWERIKNCTSVYFIEESTKIEWRVDKKNRKFIRKDLYDLEHSRKKSGRSKKLY